MRYKGLRVKRRKEPTIEKRTVTPRRPTNAAVRPREYLTGEEVKRLIETARARPGRNGHRDATMILIAYRHGCASPSWWRCAGTRSTSGAAPST
jgi:hypothetical protein